MTSKLLKILTKSLYLLPFTFLFGLIMGLLEDGYDNLNWIYISSLSVGFCLILIIMNVVSYNRVKDISEKDYLESNHEIILENADDLWNNFKNVINKQFSEYKVYNFEPDKIVVKVEKSIVKLIRDKELIKLSVERSSFDFMPDRAYNYRMIKRIQDAIIENK